MPGRLAGPERFYFLSGAGGATHLQAPADLAVGCAKAAAAVVAAEVGATATDRAAVAPGQDRIVDDQAVEGGGENLQGRPVVAEVDPDGHSQDEHHHRDLENALHQPIGKMVGKVDGRSIERLPEELVPTHGEVILEQVRGKCEDNQQPDAWATPQEKTSQNSRGQRGTQVVEENMVITVETFAADHQGCAVQVRTDTCQGDRGAFASAELAPVREPPTELQMADRAHGGPPRPDLRTGASSHKLLSCVE